MQALVAIAQIYTGRPNDILPAITQLDASEHEPGNVEDVGLDFLVTAARLGDAASMSYLAEAFDSGHNLGSDREQSYSQALSWYLLAGLYIYIYVCVRIYVYLYTYTYYICMNMNIPTR